MPKFLEKSIGSIRGAIRYFFLDLLRTHSTRIQMLWLTAFSWVTVHLYYGAFIVVVREVSDFYFKYYLCIPGNINLVGPYDQSVINSTDMAFTGTIVAYVASRWQEYRKGPNSDSSGEVNLTDVVRK